MHALRHTVRFHTLFIAALVALSASPGWAADYNDAADGNWNAPATWGLSSGYPSAAGDTATIDSNTVTVNANTTVTVSTALSGGTLALNAGLTGPMTITTTSFITGAASYYSGVGLAGGLTGTGDIILTGSGKGITIGLSYAGANNSGYSGNWYLGNNIAAGGWGCGNENKSFGTGSINMDGPLALVAFNSQAGGAAVANTINIGPNGGRIMNIDAYGNPVTLSGPINLLGNLTVDPVTNLPSGSASQAITLTGPITGAGKVILPSTRRVTLTNVGNSFNGGMDVTGILQAGGNGAIGTGTVTMLSGATLEMAANQSSPPPVVFNSGCTLSNNLSRATAPLSMSFTLGASPTITAYATADTEYSGGLALTSSATIKSASGRSVYFTGAISGAYPITTLGSGTIILNPAGGSYGFTSITNADTGTLKLLSANAVGTATVAATKGKIYLSPTNTSACVLANAASVSMQNATLQVGSAETRANGLSKPINILSAGVLVLDLDGSGNPITTPNFAVADPAQNFQLYDGAILDKTSVMDKGYVPTVDNVLLSPSNPVTGGKVYQGVSASPYTATGTFGPDSGSALQGLGTVADFTMSGTMFEAHSAGGFGFWSGVGRTITFSAANLMATGPVSLKGAGGYTFSGTANWARSTASSFVSDAGGTVAVSNQDGLPSGKSLFMNGSGSTLSIGHTGALSNGSTVTLNAGALFPVQKDIASGHVVVNGGYVTVSSTLRLGPAGTFDWSEGGSLVFSVTTAMDTNLLPTDGSTNFILGPTSDSSIISFPQGLTLGNTNRLTVSSDNRWPTGGGVHLTVGASTAINLASGATSARIANRYLYNGGAGTAACLIIAGPINMPGGRLILGDPNTFRSTNSAGTALADISQNGGIRLMNANNVVDTIEIAAGELNENNYYGDHPATIFNNVNTMQIDAGARLFLKQYTMPAMLYTGGGAINMRAGDDGNGTFTLTPTVGKNAILSPTGTLTIQGNLTFTMANSVYSKLVTNFNDTRNIPGVSYGVLKAENNPGLYNTGGAMNITSGDLEINLPLPSAAMNPTATFTAVIAKADTLIGTFHEVRKAAGTNSFWDISSALTYDTTNKQVLFTLGRANWTAHDGDGNFDNQVESMDLTLLATNWRTTGRDWSQGDFNFDGNVDSMDLTVLANNWRWSAAGGSGSPIPEPASLTLLALGAIGLIRRRK